MKKYSSEDFLKISQLVSDQSQPVPTKAGRVEASLYRYVSGLSPEERISLPATVTALSRTVYGDGFSLNSNGQNTYCLLYIYSGSVAFSTAGNPAVTVGADTLLVLQNATLYSLRQTANVPLDIVRIKCEGALVTALGQLLYQRGSARIQLPRDGEDGIEAFLRTVIPLMDTPSLANRLLISHALSSLLTHAYISGVVPADRSEHPSWFLRTHEYIETHLDKPLTVGKLATLCAMAESRFYREFKAYTGDTPYQYITNVRLRKAQQLLSTTKFQIKTVAIATGFPSANHFSAHFRRRFGMLPGEYRRQNHSVSPSVSAFGLPLD